MNNWTYYVNFQGFEDIISSNFLNKILTLHTAQSENGSFMTLPTGTGTNFFLNKEAKKPLRIFIITLLKVTNTAVWQNMQNCTSEIWLNLKHRIFSVM